MKNGKYRYQSTKPSGKLIKSNKTGGFNMSYNEPTYRIGDLVACYGDAERTNIVVGWVEDVQLYGEFGPLYLVRWSDRQQEKNAMEINEDDMGPLVELINKVKQGFNQETP